MNEGVVLERRRKKREITLDGITLVCEEIIGVDFDLLQYFGLGCQKMRQKYGCNCHKVCRFLEASYRRIAKSDSPEIACKIKIMDDALITLNDYDKILQNIRAQAQILEIGSEFNAHNARLNFQIRKHRPIGSEVLAINFITHHGNDHFRDHWNVMFSEIHSDLNRYYTWETFDHEGNDIIELFWQYRGGRAIEYFGIHHRGFSL